MNQSRIELRKVAVHNLKNIDLSLPAGQLIVFTGVSGSGKSSLAFDTIYAEGQRRYIESLSTYARRQLGEMSKPELEDAKGITPTISIEQKTAGKNPRSTVGTMTEIYDYLRVLYARAATPYCPVSGEKVLPESKEKIIRTLQNLEPGTKIIILAPFAKAKKAEFKEDFQELVRKGFTKARIDGKMLDLLSINSLDGSVSHDVDLVIDRIKVEKSESSRIAEAVVAALEQGKGELILLESDTLEERLFSTHAYSEKSGLYYSSLEPHDFSFNSPLGMCERCMGLGIVNEFDLSKIIDKDKSIAEDTCIVASSYSTVRYGNIYDNLASLYNFNIHTPWKKLPEKAKKAFLYGTEKKWTRMNFVHPVTGQTWTDHIRWRGVLFEAHERFQQAKSDTYKSNMQKLMKSMVCPDCKGARLKPYPAAAKLSGKKISEIAAMTISECTAFFKSLVLGESEKKIAGELLKEIQTRLDFLKNVGLDYLTIDRGAPTLSGGEAQRVRLASQIGCGLVGITYVLDEPSIGLHARDNKKLIETIKRLKDIGNTVIVVEHDEETIAASDYVVDFGPGPGVNGGEIVFQGSLKGLLAEKKSLTGQYLNGTLKVAPPKKRKKPGKEKLKIIGATHHNLKDVTVEIPLGLFVSITGVSGSGKSSLITDILYPALSNALMETDWEVGVHKEITGAEFIDKVIAIDQSPIGRNPRSNPATYIKVFDEIRDLFAKLPESLSRGYKPGRFSFNVKEGTCHQCLGLGMIKIDMDFLEDEWVACSACHGRRFDEETLSVLFKGKNIYDVLEMDVQEAHKLFENIPSIKNKLSTLEKVGLGYIKLGQSSTTLSGGEAQRVKLAKELVRPATGKTVYIFDEPTTGLHFHDVKHLIHVLQELVDRGNSVIVIEHNIDIVKTSDWVIDLGPEGGSYGGQIIAKGTPEAIAKTKTPTGAALEESFSEEIKKRILGKKEDQKEADRSKEITSITVESAEQHNLKHLDLEIPRNKMTIFTGPSGSGKSSLAFDTIYAEGQRRYVDSLSPYARQFVQQMPKPKVGRVDGLSPAIAIEQKAHAGNPRSTIGTMTEIYDYLRVLYARAGIPHSPETGEELKSISKEYIADQLLALPVGSRLQILAPLELKRSEKFEEVLAKIRRQGYVRIRLNGIFYDLDEGNEISFDPKRKNHLYLVIDRLKVDPSTRKRLLEALQIASDIGLKKLVVMKGDEDIFYNIAFSAVKEGKSYPEITPQTFAFNNQEGMCLECSGLGYLYGAHLSQNPIILASSTAALIKDIWGSKFSKKAFECLCLILQEEGIDPFLPLSELSSDKLSVVFNGTPEKNVYNTPYGFKFRWIGISHVLAKAGRNALSHLKEAVLPLLDEIECFACKGTRLNPLARNVTINGLSISDFCKLPIHNALKTLDEISLKKDKKVLEEVFQQIKSRLKFLNDVGLDYISLDRKAPSLSGGEAQRIRLARQLGSGLTGALYVLDEPTIGLHPSDTERLHKALKQLKELGNTLIMVEHDPLTIEKADYIFDFGPKSGEQGGHITASGSYKQLLKNPNSLTGAYLSNKKLIPIPEKKNKLDKGFFTISQAKKHNLKGVNVKFPISALTVLTGVSGSGKSTLLEEVIEPLVKKSIEKHSNKVSSDIGTFKTDDLFDRLILIDQDPIGLTVRSLVGTYVDFVPKMREFFANLPEAKKLGLQGKHFSSNHRAGMCTSCWGLGYKRVELHFLPSVQVVCPECQGMRLNPLSLKVLYHNKNFGEHLESTIEEARLEFENFPRMTRILDTLISVGLGYLKLGQEVSTLSGGEAQRLKLTRELAKRSTGKTLYLLDEPTTGLHPDDIEKLLKVLHKLVHKGNTMIIIEHHLDMMMNADWLIDLGPGGGEHGGSVIYSGKPEGITSKESSKTAPFIKRYLEARNETTPPKKKKK